MMDVGTVFVPVPAVKDRLLVKLMVSACPVGIVITTGDHPGTAAVVAVAGTATGAFGFRARQVAVEVTPVARAPQV